MSLSLNEVETLAKKAARGVGYPWGLAEEAAKATRWLCARDVDGCGVLAGLLEQVDGSDLVAFGPIPGDIWTAEGGTLCPVFTGAALADAGAADSKLERIAAPLMLVPFAAQLASDKGTAIRVVWPGGRAATDGDALFLEGEVPDTAAEVTVGAGAGVTSPNTRRSRAEPLAEVRARLERYAHRTYAPATEESRLKGAGAGLSDND